MGRREFWSLTFKVTADTLDPRPDSETLVQAVLGQVPDPTAALRLVDFGTGTGNYMFLTTQYTPTAPNNAKLRFGIRTTVALLHQIDPSLEEASSGLGAGRAATFRRVVLPLIVPAFFAGLGVVFIRSMTAISATIFLVSVEWTLVTVRILENMTELALGPAALGYHVVASLGRRLDVVGEEPGRVIAFGAAGVAVTLIGCVLLILGSERAAKAPEGELLNARLRDQWTVAPECIDVKLGTDGALPSCVLGDADGEVTVVLWGESHALHWQPALEPLLKREFEPAARARCGGALLI